MTYCYLSAKVNQNKQTCILHIQCRPFPISNVYYILEHTEWNAELDEYKLNKYIILRYEVSHYYLLDVFWLQPGNNDFKKSWHLFPMKHTSLGTWQECSTKLEEVSANNAQSKGCLKL